MAAAEKYFENGAGLPKSHPTSSSPSSKTDSGTKKIPLAMLETIRILCAVVTFSPSSCSVSFCSSPWASSARIVGVLASQREETARPDSVAPTTRKTSGQAQCRLSTAGNILAIGSIAALVGCTTDAIINFLAGCTVRKSWSLQKTPLDACRQNTASLAGIAATAQKQERSGAGRRPAAWNFAPAEAAV